ncbi:Cysteine-rich repeat secretory protein [Quillaja saponaria]|uniref:Cysteine-rich repeat secretory protein n=1 Tax=Quillaja saponaria TaxID=32244 RepID=A0AAD7PA79_QUISA|nr:Cysteine-rich repeat secretory protein [Quillaja saponaria]
MEMLNMKSIPLSLLLFSLLLQAGNCANSAFLFHFCFSKENYTANSPYDTNLNELFDLLSTKVPPTGFGFDTITGKCQNQVSGLALCRGDVSSENCKSCINDASKELRKRCPNKKDAIIWYDYCFLKYSNEYFFGEIDTKNKFFLLNGNKVDNSKTFNPKVNELLSSLAKKATATPKLYATGDLKLEGSETLYGLAQCTRDLSGPDCKKCLDVAISEVPNCCDGQRGGRTVGGSCNVRYELYPIVDAS